MRCQEIPLSCLKAFWGREGKELGRCATVSTHGRVNRREGTTIVRKNEEVLGRLKERKTCTPDSLSDGQRNYYH